MLDDGDHSGGCPRRDNHDLQEDEGKDASRKRDESVDQQGSEAAENTEQRGRAPHVKSSLSATQKPIDEPIYDLFSTLRMLVSRYNNSLDVIIYMAGMHMCKGLSGRIYTRFKRFAVV
jgi:hypothetical protein